MNFNDTQNDNSYKKIKLNLNEKAYICNKNIRLFDVIDSTNNYLLEYAKKGSIEHGSVVIAYEQTAGKGRLGRSFYSPPETGLYMSILIETTALNKEFSENPTLITVFVAVAAARAIEKKCNIQAKIKWVNDLYYEQKKICGILTEGIFNKGKIKTSVIGIGINLCTNNFPNELAGKAGSIFRCKELPDNFRLELAEEILNNLFDVVLYAEKTQIIDEYKEKSCILGSVVKVISNSESYEAKAIDISFDGELVIEHTNGQKAFLKTGEISLKFT